MHRSRNSVNPKHDKCEYNYTETHSQTSETKDKGKGLESGTRK